MNTWDELRVGNYQLDHRMVAEQGIRRSVLEMVRMLNVPVMRCPASMGADTIGSIQFRSNRLNLA